MASSFINDILDSLTEAGLDACVCSGPVSTIICRHSRTGRPLRIMPVDISSHSLENAASEMSLTKDAMSFYKESDLAYPIVIARDRWERRHYATLARLLAHLGLFSQVYARNCEVRRIDKAAASGFLDEYHSYGDANCRYRYGLFLKRHTGHLACNQSDTSGNPVILPGDMVAVAAFSGVRRWRKGDKIIRSYEWVRYASLPHVRISGGMGKVLGHFIKEVCPDDIMSYADLEWSEGSVYEELGFVKEGYREPVSFTVDPVCWTRTPYSLPLDGALYHKNLGSCKYRLKLIEYQ